MVLFVVFNILGILLGPRPGLGPKMGCGLGPGPQAECFEFTGNMQSQILKIASIEFVRSVNMCEGAQNLRFTLYALGNL